MDKHILKESAQRLRENMKISVENGLEQGFKHFQKDWVYMYDMFSERGFDLKWLIYHFTVQLFEIYCSKIRVM